MNTIPVNESSAFGSKYFKNKFTAPATPMINKYDISVQKMKEGIARNQYTHYTGNDPSSCPECLHERCQGWKLDLCAECNATLSSERLETEQKRAEIIMLEDKEHALLNIRPHVEHLHNLGIHIVGLLAFAFAHDCFEWPVWQVVRDIIVPATRDNNRCRYGDLPEFHDDTTNNTSSEQGTKLFGKATVFMSHCWAASFGDLVGAACHGARTDRYVWIDIFAVRQWPGNVADLNFRGVIQRCKAMIVSVSPIECLKNNGNTMNTDERAAFLSSKQGMAAKKILAFFRLWCVVEIASAVHNNKSIVVKGGTFIQIPKSPKERTHSYTYDISNDMDDMLINVKGMIDAERSECAVQEDYDREMKIIRQLDGGVNSINKLIQSVVHSAYLSSSEIIQCHMLEIDAALCGEWEALLQMKIYHLSNAKEMWLAERVLDVCVAGNRVELVRFLLQKWSGNDVKTNVKTNVKDVKDVKDGEDVEHVEDGEDNVEDGEKKVKEKAPAEKALGTKALETKEAKESQEMQLLLLCQLIDETDVVLFAARDGLTEILRLLIDFDVDLTKDNPLHLACSIGHFDVVKVLVLNGKDRIEIKKKNWMGKTPLEEAKENKHHTIVHFLEAVEAAEEKQIDKNVHVE